MLQQSHTFSVAVTEHFTVDGVVSHSHVLAYADSAVELEDNDYNENSIYFFGVCELA